MPLVIAAGVASWLWGILVLLVCIAAIAVFIWGGSNEAHLRCLDHRLGAPGLVDSAACIVEH